MIDLAQLARDYAVERPKYEALEHHVVRDVRDALLAAGMAPSVSSRVKDYPSLARKAVKKGWPDAIHRTPDLLGLRIVLPFSRLKDSVVRVLERRFAVSGDDDKVTRYGVAEFRYLGRHMQVEYRPGEEPDPRVRGCQAEVQLHTHAEAAWANASHDLTYKAALDLPDALQRRVNRLLALVELFDNEMTGAQSDLVALPNFPAARMLQPLERAFLPLALRDFDRELSAVVLSAVAGAYDAGELDTFEQLVSDFIEARAQRLRELYARWATDPFAHPLALQPEAIAVFERLERNPVGLRQHWDDALPPNLLESLGELWGVVLSRPGEVD